jgi:hypothetical protein
VAGVHPGDFGRGVAIQFCRKIKLAEFLQSVHQGLQLAPPGLRTMTTLVGLGSTEQTSQLAVQHRPSDLGVQ